MFNTQPQGSEHMHALSVCVKGIGRVICAQSHRENSGRDALILRPRTNLRIVPQCNSITNHTGFCSPWGLGFEKMARIVVNRQLAQPSYFYIIRHPEEKSNERDVANGVLQKEVSVQRYQFVTRFEVPRIQWTIQFTWMAPADLGLVINLVGLKTVERNIRF
jgi:hypothetical protein